MASSGTTLRDAAKANDIDLGGEDRGRRLAATVQRGSAAFEPRVSHPDRLSRVEYKHPRSWAQSFSRVDWSEESRQVRFPDSAAVCEYVGPRYHRDPVLERRLGVRGNLSSMHRRTLL